LLFQEQFLQPLQERRERFGGNILKRLSDHLELIADGNANPLGAMVQGKDAHTNTLLSTQAGEHFLSDRHRLLYVLPGMCQRKKSGFEL